MAKSVLNAVIREFFEMDESAFDTQWRKLTATDKSHIRSGIGDGSLNY